jgi:hypothetical protein
MGIRESLNQNQGIVICGATAIVLVAVLVIGIQLWPGGRQVHSRAFYTIDDGQNLIVDRIDRHPPFEIDGRQAVRAYVFTCDGGRTRFVGYLERYTPDAHRHLEQMRDRDPQHMEMGMDEIIVYGSEVRRPNMTEGVWIPRRDTDRAEEVTDVRCPDGTIEHLKPVFP